MKEKLNHMKNCYNANGSSVLYSIIIKSKSLFQSRSNSNINILNNPYENK